MSDSIIELKNVSKRFPKSDVNAVDHVSFTINKGEFVIIVGASGSGKTTLLKMINRLYEPTEGQILLNGENALEGDPAEYRRKIGYVIQQSGLFPHMTVHENIAVVPKIMKWDSRRIEARVKELMEMIDLDYEKYHKRFPRELSGGEQQRVGLARGLAVDPEVVLMDEPFGAVDAITRAKLQDQVLDLQKRMKKTIVFVTHDIQEAFKLGDRILIMNHGKIQQYDTVFNILFHPANDYVKSLLSRVDFVEKLQAVSAGEIMDSLREGGLPENETENVPFEVNLKYIYQLFLVRKLSQVIVTKDGDKVGLITKEKLDQYIRDILTNDMEM